MTSNTHTDLALAPPAQNSENTNNPLLAVASSEIVLPDSPQDVEGESMKSRFQDRLSNAVCAVLGLEKSLAGYPTYSDIVLEAQENLLRAQNL